jgi:hypothetical protein
MRATARATADTRYSFTAQFLCSSAIFARRCAKIEAGVEPDEQTRTEHRGLVTAAIMQATAAVEAESAEVLSHGPGHHLGSNGVDIASRDFLAPLAEMIDRQQEPLERYQGILHLLHKAPLDRGEQPWQDMAILIKLRNQLTHYKSQWGQQMEGKDLFKSLQKLRLKKPPFIPTNTNFFPHQCLSAGCAAWSVRTAVKFINVFYERLEVRSPLTAYMAQFEGL